MHKVHVTAHYQKSLEEVFAAISDHSAFLSGGGMTCKVIKPGTETLNGQGAKRTVETSKYTFFEDITAYIENESYDYQITEIRPDLALKHHNGWIEFKEVAHMKVQVDWHSHFTITTPVIGHFIGWIVKFQVKKTFLKRLNYIKHHWPEQINN